MITKVLIHNFKCLRDVTVDLERFTVFVGPNGSGKSSILQALDHLCERFHVDHPHNLDDKLKRNLSRGAEQVDLRAEVDGQAFRYHTPPSSPHEQWLWNGRGTAASVTALDWQPWEAKTHVSPHLPCSVLLRLETSSLRWTGKVADPTIMSPDGTGLHSALANIALSDPESWHTLQENLRQIVPTVRRIRHTLKGRDNSPELLFDMIGADSVMADHVSEGTLLVLGLLAALHASDRPNLILLDDLDRGLHPKAQKELISLLRGLLDTNPDLQLIATTHSPYLLDSMEVDEVRMTFLNDEGATVCSPLTSHPKYPKWKDEMTPGEMWSLFGEKWVIEGVTV